MTTTLFHTLTFRDADAAVAFLEVVGFTRRALMTSAPGVVDHAEYAWGDRGGIMFGSAGRRTADDEHLELPGTSSCYCVVETDEEVDAVYDRALAAGGTSVQAPMDPDYGGRTCTVRDAEGNQWSFGSYPGQA